MSDLVLADTSIWVTHFRIGENHLIQLLEALPEVSILEHQEVMSFIESRKIMSKGIGYVDTHLLGSAILSGIPLWTFDKSLIKIAFMLNVGYNSKYR